MGVVRQVLSWDNDPVGAHIDYSTTSPNGYWYMNDGATVSSVSPGSGHSLHIPPQVNPGDTDELDWFGTTGPVDGVMGIDATFKFIVPSTTVFVNVSVAVGGNSIGFQGSVNSTAPVLAAEIRSPDLVASEVTVDFTQWLRAMILPDGSWAFGYAGGSWLMSGSFLGGGVGNDHLFIASGDADIYVSEAALWRTVLTGSSGANRRNFE